ncbi:probable helicase senataxin isoform X2 [Vombatus ursinus]|uniref:Probable helicase senataxin n=2 Tax=Vombatus ursinus TaxID=29139 RepID=A0A4X2L4X1_VOMUR|nr:probable helicase senataxin isoform X2 [Vombatus ursinus]XP_027725092.1 probable helicase senataxin isoform X2 [Vombatus ursinus]
MSTCRWCTPGGESTVDFLKSYAFGTLPCEVLTANEDLCYCLECVAEYHKARDKLPSLHEILWKFETTRLINHFEKSMKGEIEEDDELFIVDDNGETQLFGFTGQDFENKLRVPLLEVLKYPYLLLDEHVNELCVEALCRMEQANCSFQVFDKHPGIYLFLVHPNEMVRRWAILTARNLGKVDRDDYYDLQEVLTCLFRVIELGLLESPDIYTSSEFEKGKLVLLPSHMYDTNNYKNYWLGICMLLTILEEQAMDSLLLGSDKQNDFMQSILHTMEKQSDEDSVDPFWPALHCFMVILDRLGSKVWGQLIDPIEAFQTIINNVSYNKEIQNIRNSSTRTKLEPESDLEEMVTCSQIVYNYNPEKTKKDSGWRSAICPDYCPNMYEEMETLASVLQSDIGQDMRVHNSTFLWFIPFVQSLMDLKDLGVAYIVEVIHHLYSEVKDVLNQKVAVCDTVTEFFLLILVSVIELHRNKNCLHLLWVSSQQWVEAVVKCAKLPTIAFARSAEKTSGSYSKGATVISSLPLHSIPSNSVQLACVQLIRSLLREGCQLGQQTLCKQFLDKLNLLLRGNLSLGWHLNSQETLELQTCLKQIIKSKKVKGLPCSTFVDRAIACKTPPAIYIKEESDATMEKSKKDTYSQDSSSPPFSKEPLRADVYQGQDSPSLRRNYSWEEENKQTYLKESKLDDHFSTKSCLRQEKNPDANRSHNHEILDNVEKQKCTEENNSTNIQQNLTSKNNAVEGGYDRTTNIQTCLMTTDSRSDSPQNVSSSSDDSHSKNDSGFRNSKFRTKAQKDELCAKLLQVMKEHKKTTMVTSVSNLESKQSSSNLGSHNPCKDVDVQKGFALIQKAQTEPCITPKETTNEEQESRNDDSLVEKKKSNDRQLDPLTFHKKDDLPQESDSDEDDDDMVSLKTIRNTLLKKKCQLLHHTDRHESKDSNCEEINNDNDHVPHNLAREEVPPQNLKFSTLTDSDKDKDLDRPSFIVHTNVLNFPSDSTPESSYQLQRKVKNVMRLSEVNQVNELTSVVETTRNQIIIISDDDDDDDDGGDERSPNLQKQIKTDKIGIKREFPEENPSTSNAILEKKLEKEEKTKSPLLDEESDSQFFEFETPYEVFSVWQNSEPESKNSVQESEPEQDSFLSSTGESAIDDQTNDWGYDTDYISDEVIQKVAETLEEHLDSQCGVFPNEKFQIESKSKKQLSKVPMAEDLSLCLRKVDKPRICISGDLIEEHTKNVDEKEEKESTSTLPVSPNLNVEISSEESGEQYSPQSLSSPKLRRPSLSKNSKKTNVNPPRRQNKKMNQASPKKILCRTMPAVIPPKKFRQCPEPTSTAEKLGLKKRPRKAFDLSQRSLDYVVKLRDHGKTAGEVDIQQKKKTKLITPQTLVVKNNKKMLACQDLQFLRQIRPKSHKNQQGRSATHSKDSSPKAITKPVQNSETIIQASSGPSDNFKEKNKLAPGTDKKHQRKSSFSETETVKAKSLSPVANNSPLSTKQSCAELNVRAETNGTTVSTSKSPLSNSSSVGGDLTGVVQPLSCFHSEGTASREADSDVNSDTEENNLFLTQHDPVDMELSSQVESFHDLEIPIGKDRMEEDSENLTGDRALSSIKCKHKDCTDVVENLNEYCSIHSEAKVSDDYVFAKPGLPLSLSNKTVKSTTKIFSSSSNSRNAHLSRAIENSLKLPPASKNQTNLRTTTTSKLMQPVSPLVHKPVLNDEGKNLSNILQPQKMQTSPNYFNRPAPPSPLEKKRTFQTSSANFPVQQSVFDSFVKEILKWKYEMFVNFDQFGPPADLCQSTLRSVPVTFQDCQDYLNVFFPLLMLNTFETVAQEWIDNPKKENAYELHLRSFSPGDINCGQFVVCLQECDMTKQLHPKENDLVFLVPKKLNGKKKAAAEESEMKDQQVYHCGYVSQFRRSSVRHNSQFEGCLSIQTQGNLSFHINESVDCIVISSLVTTQRKLKALSLLGRNSLIPLARAILNPSTSDFCPRDSLNMAPERILAYLKDYNEDQKKAIEVAYAMVKQPPLIAKICLIHGPPGTGKSKTIVGLLYRILTEKPRKGDSDENLNAKIKRNRVLVCAPSNAAVDELMKKIILEFKEKCQDKKNPLGNCGDINLVRLGPEKSINNEVLKFSLDSQVNHRMKKDLPSHVQEMHERKEHLDIKLDKLSRQRALDRCEKGQKRSNLDEEIARISKERQQLASKIKEVRGRPQETQSSIILESHIICCTLSTSGGLLLESAFRRQGGVPFSCVIVDEAGQSCEIETLTPFIHRCNKLILVGDPKQLPPTVISVKAQEYGYDQSMMARLYKHLEEQVKQNVISRSPVLQLTVQYRMHPDICLFPSSYIYNRTLKTNRLTEESRCTSDWPFQPYLVFDVEDGSEKRENDSYVNVQEIKLVVELIKLIKDKRKDITVRNIGIITHYKAQKMMIQQELDKEFERNRPGEVDTVDAFQGRQKDCIIVTCVRANTSQGSIGFLASLQRLNVTITRAKYSLFILGHLKTLMENHHWNELIQDAQKRGAIIRTCVRNYKCDAVKILKLKSVPQRTLPHPPTVMPEVTRSQNSLPINKPKEVMNKPDNGISKTTSVASPRRSSTSLLPADIQPLDCREAAVVTKATEVPVVRDPRLAKRNERDATEKFPSDTQPSSSQHPRVTAPSCEPGLPLTHQDPPSNIIQHLFSKGTASNSCNLTAQLEAPSASTSMHTMKRKASEEEGSGYGREVTSSREGQQENHGYRKDYHLDRDYCLDRRRKEHQDNDSKRKKLS